ncbi:TetR family transcriptional regulator [Neorhizobium sp. SOG26]|jgi:Transcriptional regulator|uniref:TetR/AcrR family transcriptional regulator n=1 Tax=Neorhizobium turbinariae TaxID=2937795 RepID=A0ABT0IMA3_9HYPH|nr:MULTISPECIES: TetR/AcrR family transcriptional regulator [Neorhizobium]AXV16266.1 TetR family transcriptional regulator [Neorhizobium sp. SOG26]MCK8778968.1 TetR/AcrR family transcriptional regulator [Neorhizobium turbinariae]
MASQKRKQEKADPVPAGRFAAGADPAKREQIIEGAKAVFMRLGFDAASMNDITREAGVSKGTIYVYFENKEALFGAIVAQEKERITHQMRDILAGSEEVEDGLYRFGMGFTSHITAPQVIDAMRTVIGVVDRLPRLCQHFFNSPSQNVRTVLEEFIERHIELGNLKVDDKELAARQFIDMSSATFFKARLFGDLLDVPPEHELSRAVKGAIRVFMAAYGTHDASVIAKVPEPA